MTIELLDSHGTVIATTTTLPNGTYAFPTLPPGMYSVHEVTPPVFINTTPDLVAVTVTPGGAFVVDFGNARPGENGQFCVSGGQCLSMNCVTHVCCDTACTESGRSCTLPGREGTCLPTRAAPAPTLSGVGKVIGLAVLLLIGGAQLLRRRSRRS